MKTPSYFFSRLYQSAAVLAAVFLLSACGGGGGAAEGPATTITAEVKVNPDGPAEHYRGEVIALVATASIKDDGGTEGGLRLALMLENTKQEADTGGLSFAWELAGPADSTATLSGEAKQTASFTPDKVGEYTVKLTVTETANSSNTVTKTETLEVVNQLPTLELGVADGGRTSLYPTETTTLEATATDPDPEGEATFTYTWTVSKKLESAGSGGQEEDVTSSDVLAAAGGETALDNASEVVFTAPEVEEATEYIVSVTVEDADGGESEAKEQILTVTPITVSASFDVSQEGTPENGYYNAKEISLDASGSRANAEKDDTNDLSFEWVVTDPSNTQLDLGDAATSMATFTPDKLGEYTVKLTVTDTANPANTATTEQTLEVVTQPPTVTLDVAENEKSSLYKGESTTLEATASDPDGEDSALVYTWTVRKKQTSEGDEAIEENVDLTTVLTAEAGTDLTKAKKVVFTAPAMEKNTTYTVSVSLTDEEEGQSQPAELSLFTAPSLRAVIPQPTGAYNTEGQIDLDGSESTGLGLQYEWTLESSPIFQNDNKQDADNRASNTRIASTSEKETSFTPDKAGKYRARLKVTDDRESFHIWEQYFIVETAEEPANNTLPFAQAIQNLDGAQTDETDQSKPVLYAGQAQHLLLAAGDADGGGEILTTQWTVSAQNGAADACGDFANTGIYQNTLYGLLQVPEDTPVGTVCEVTVEFYDGYSFTAAGSFETATKTEEFVVQAAPAVVQVVALDASGAEVATFSLPDTTKTYKTPTSFMKTDGTTATVARLKIGTNELELSSTGDLTTPTGETITFEPVADAVAVYDNATLGNLSGTNGTYYQVGIIDLRGKLHEPHDAASQWTPVAEFSGDYNGQGLAIKNVLVYQPDADYKGLFGRISGNTASLAKMAVQGVNIYGNSNVGGLVGHAGIGSTITGSHATGAVKGKWRNSGGLVGYATIFSSITGSHAAGAVRGKWDVAGGLVGYTEGSITGSHATGAVSGKNYVGGLVGNASYNNTTTITGSHATGAVSGEKDYVGGLVGSADYRSAIIDSHATGDVTGGRYSVGGLVGSAANRSTITGSHATGNVTGMAARVGGLVGYTEGSITDSHATGAVSGEGDFVGGLVGYSYGDVITSSYATGAVSGEEDYVGGLLGFSYENVITSSYATGAVSGEKDYVGGLVGGAKESGIRNSYAMGAASGSNQVGGLLGWDFEGSTISTSYATGSVMEWLSGGGLVGWTDDDITSASYWDTETTGKRSSAGGGEGKSTAEMKTQATYLPQEDPDSMNDPDTDAWWDFTAVWGIDATINDGYPYLLCAGGQGDHTPDESCSTE